MKFYSYKKTVSVPPAFPLTALLHLLIIYPSIFLRLRKQFIFRFLIFRYCTRVKPIKILHNSACKKISWKLFAAMEQKSQQQTTVTIKEEITDNTCSVKENNNIQRSVKMTLKGMSSYISFIK